MKETQLLISEHLSEKEKVAGLSPGTETMVAVIFTISFDHAPGTSGRYFGILLLDC